MATGDPTDTANRLWALVPPWFGDRANSPIVSGILAGFASGLSWAYGLIQVVKQQTRIATACGPFLDIIAYDFLGLTLVRAPNQSDTSFRARILAQIIRPRATRASLVQVLATLTGRVPVIFEPTRPVDTGAYGVAAASGYGVAGGYGSLLLPGQAFVTAYRPVGAGIPTVAGYGVSTGAYGTASRSQYGSLAMIQATVVDADIYAAIDSVKPAGVTVWTKLSN